MVGNYGIAIVFFIGIIAGAAIYHICLKSASKMVYTSKNDMNPGKDTGQIEQDYSE